MKRNQEERAMVLLQQVIDISNEDRDALPGSAVKKVKEAQTIMKKRRKRRQPRPRTHNNG